MNENSDLTSLTVVLSFALAIVWMQRHGRWALFAKGLTGKLVISNSRQGLSTSSGANGTNTSSLPPAPSGAQKGWTYALQNGKWVNFNLANSQGTVGDLFTTGLKAVGPVYQWTGSNWTPYTGPTSQAPVKVSS